MTFKAATPAQNIDVQFFQTRNAGEWKARVKLRHETLIFGPCSMKTLAINVAQLLKSEAAYADAVVHELEPEDAHHGVDV